MKVKVLFDFQANPDSSELNIVENEVLTVVNQDVGEGWWEGINERGERGLFPASYVEQVADSSGRVAAGAPTPAAAGFDSGQPSPQQQQQQSGSFFAPNQSAQFRPTSVPKQSGDASRMSEEPDWPDEDWDDDEDSGDDGTEYGTTAAVSTGQQRPYSTVGGGGLAGQPQYNYGTAANQQAASGGGHIHAQDLALATTNLSISDNRASVISAGAAGQAGGVRSRKNFNRFTNFVKSGLETFILEPRAINVPRENMVDIQYDQELGIVWKPNTSPYTCAVTKHGKETKMKGLKTYISYDITPSTSNIVVRRRYKHFDWLMQRLEEKFPLTPLPPLPEKQIAGRFQEDFVEHRRNLLQLWVNYITRHPVLSQCDVWWHFMTCSTDDMKGWKLGKRKAEKDELVGGNFFFAIDTSQSTPLDPVKTSKQLDNFQRFVVKLDEAVKHMYTTAVDQSKKVSTVYAKDYKKLSESIKELSSAFQSGTAWRNSLGLNEAIRQTSAAYEDISRLHEEEPKFDFEPMADILHQYRGLLSSWPEILQSHKGTVNTRNDQERLLDEGKISQSELQRISQRTNVVTYATLAEINHFHTERLVDFKQMMQVFLTAQINFHSDIVGKLQTALNKVNDA